MRQTTDHLLLFAILLAPIAPAMASDRLPCIKIGGKYEPVDEHARSTDAILEMLTSVGGSRYVEDLDSKPAAWTERESGRCSPVSWPRSA